MIRWLRLLFFVCTIPTTVSLSTPLLAAPEICPLSEVRAGQVAMAKSVFRGTKIESFRVEIVGVVPKFDGTRSVIFGRVLDGPVVRRQSGVIGGMSGSPVYIDGRLAGAIAYAWPWSKEPLAGIQPIEEMLGALQERGVPRMGSATSVGVYGPLVLEGSPIGEIRVSNGQPLTPDPPGTVTLVPLGGLVQVSGFSPRAIDSLRETLAPYGLRIGAGGAGARQELTPPLEPGAALGAVLVSGDFEMTALGTLTMRDGDRVLGFGHPIFQRGQVDFPMTGGYVYDIMPSQYVSNKIMSPTRTVGRVYSDHRSAIAGLVGGQADMMPVSISVDAGEDIGAHTYQIEVARLRELAPGLVASSVVTAIDEVRGFMSRGTARVRVEVESEGRKLIREDVMYSPADIAAAAVPMVVTPISLLTENPFGSRRVDQVAVTIETTEERQTAEIERVTLRQSRVQAGDEIEFLVSVRPYGKEAVEIPLRLSLPEDLPEGRLRIVVSGGGEAEQARNAIGAPRPNPVMIEQLLDRYQELPANSDLVLQAALPRAGAALLGEEFPSLPQTMLQALRASNPTDLRPLPSVAKVSRATQWVLAGRQALSVQVESPIGRQGIPKPPGGPPEPPEEEADASGFSDSLQALAVEASARPVAARRPPPNDTKKDEEEKPKALTREVEHWTHSTGADYAEAELDGIVLSSDGSLRLGAVRTDLGTIPADVVWSLAVRDGTTYVGTGSEGTIYRVTGDGEVAEFFATGEVGVHALAFSPEGDLYAGTSPRGRLFRISPEGKGEAVFESESDYVWALEVDSEGAVYAGAGSPGRVYKITAQGEGAVLADLPIANVLSLALTDTGVVFAGTADTGVIYRIDPDGTVSTLAQMPGTSVDALILDAEGQLYASSSPDGAVYLIPGDGQPELYLETGQQLVFGLALPKDGPLAVATGGRGLVIQAGTDGKPELVYQPERSRFATAIAEDDGAICVAHSAPCRLSRLGPVRASAGTVESEVLDAERPARWGRVRWEADLPEDASITVETRSGDSPTPGKHWTPWVETSDDVIMSPAARYLQYRLHLQGGEGEAAPVVRQISVSRQPQNRPPEIALRSPESGQRLSGKAELKWQGRDPDQDTLVYEIQMSPDLGATWEAVEEGTDEQKYELDTTERDDGRYLLKVTATDRQSAPSDPESADATAVIWIDNVEPALLVFRNSLSVDEERRAHVTGMASDELSPIQSIEYRVGDKDWRSLPLTGVDAMLSEVGFVTERLDPGGHAIEVRAFDAAGNMAVDKVEVEVQDESAEEEAEEAAVAPASQDDQTEATGTLDDEAQDEQTAGSQEIPGEPEPEEESGGESNSLAPSPAAPES